MNTTNFNEVYQKTVELISSNPDNLLLKICELLKVEVYHYDWVGFYILDPAKNELVLGPFVGKPTQHTHIAVGKVFAARWPKAARPWLFRM